MKKYFTLPDIDSEFINSQDYIFVFETNLVDRANYKSYIFSDPLEIIETNTSSSIESVFEKIEELSEKYYIIGYFAYEMGYAFEKTFDTHEKYPFPVICLAVFDKAFEFDHSTGEFQPYQPEFNHERPEDNFTIDNLNLINSKEEYVNAIDHILLNIQEGNTYQVNYTTKYKFDFNGSPFSFYKDLKKKQKVAYSSFLKCKDRYIISLSPELFFRKTGNHIVSMPMKGTMERGKSLHDDQNNKVLLENCEKNRAENTMIVDLIRNDLGKISKFGTVKANQLYSIEKYDTLFQMTSTVIGDLNDNIKFRDIFQSLFPCGSVTGAPKISSMKIIKSLEKEFRDVYCGAVGMIFPGKDAVFNVPIRTCIIKNGKGELGIGSGIVADSDPVSEFEECLLKADFLTQKYTEFDLLETLLWDNEYKFLNEHLTRMSDSAIRFDYIFDKEKLLAKLRLLEQDLQQNKKYRIRILLSKSGEIKTEHVLIENSTDKNNTYVISDIKTDPANILLYHKTTSRELYNSEHKIYSDQGHFDVIFTNTKRELTEGAISNIIIKKDGEYNTPPVSCGLLNGVYRQYLITSHNTKEKTLYPDDLENAEAVFLCNSVRGLVRVFQG